MDFPIIESQRIKLRELNTSDLTCLFEIYSNQNAMRYWDSVAHSARSETNTMLHDMHRAWHINKGITWAIELRKTSTLIGQITIHNWNKKNHVAKLGYIFNPIFWGMGFGTETLKLVIKFACCELGLKNIFAEIDPENYSSAAILKKNGFQFIKKLKNDLMKNGLYYDSNMYQLIPAHSVINNENQTV